jgi:serine/threonine-protein kinase
MGAVLRGRDPRLGRELAVKVLLEEHRGDPALVQRFLEEAQVGGQLQHPGVAPVYDTGALADGRPYFAMKLVKGRTLADLLAARPAPGHDLPRFLGIFEQVCQTVAYAHSKGVLHRDLKPANVMVGAFGEVQVMDWGLAKVLGGAAAGGGAAAPAPVATSAVRTVRTAAAGAGSAAGMVLGTFAYMAPEQALGEVGGLDERADVFGLGAILCEVLTGQPPYVAPEAGEVHRGEVHRMAARGDLADAFARLGGSSADPELLRLAKACLAPAREERPRDAGAVAQAVAAQQAGVQERLRQAELGRAQAQVKAAEERKRRRLTVGLAAALLSLLAGAAAAGTWYVWEQQSQTRKNVERSLKVAERFLRQNRLAEADGALKQAVSELEEPSPEDWPEDIRLRLRQDYQDLDLAGRIDRIRLQRATARDVSSPPLPAAPQYAAALWIYGLDLAGDGVEKVSAQIEGRTIKEQVVAALDDWAAEEPDRGLRARLLAVAQRADPGQWGKRFRAAAVQGNRKALQGLAYEAEQRLGRF